MQAHSADNRPQHPGGPVILVHVLGCLIYVGLVLQYSALGLTVAEIVYPLCVAVTLLSLWCLWSWWWMTGTLFSPYSIFFLAAALFNAGQAFLEVLRLNVDGILGDEFREETIAATLILVTIGLAFFHLGALTAALAMNPRPRDEPATVVQSRLSTMRFVGWGLLLAALGPSLILGVNALRVVGSSGYFALYQQESATGIGAIPKLIADFLVPGAILVLASSGGRWIDVALALAVVAANSAVQLFLGYRAFAIWPVLACVWLYHRLVRPLPGTVLLGGGAFLLFVVFPLVAVTRNTSGAERDSAAYLWESYRSIDNPVVAIVTEMGGSMRTVADTIELVPAVRPHDLGIGYLYALTTVVPNVFGAVHPAIAHGTASDWLIWQVDPYIAAQGGGLGYSFIAEAFLSFGWLGTPVFLALLGFGFGALFLWADRSNDPLKIALAAIFLAFLTHYARGEAATIIRPFVWYALGPYVLVRALAALTAGGQRSGSTVVSRTGTP